MIKKPPELVTHYSTNNLSNQNDDPPPFNFAVIQRIVQARCENLRDDILLGLSELAEEIGVKSDELLYWEKSDILRPILASKGERPVRKYPLTEIKKAHIAHELQKLGWRQQKIAGVIAVWREQESGSPAPPAELSQTGRARMLLIARLLALVTQLAGGLKTPPRDCVLLARRLIHPSEFPIQEVETTEKDETQVVALLDQKNLIAGVSSEKGEVHLYFRDTERLREKARGCNYIAVRLRGNLIDEAFEIIYGFKAVNGDGQALQLRRNLVSDRIEDIVSISQRRFLLRLLHFLCVTTLNLEAKLAALSLEDLDIVHTLINSVPLVAPHKWDFASFLIPVNSANMRVLAASRDHPQRLKEQLYTIGTVGVQKSSLPGWTYTHRDYILIENIGSNDLRLPDQNPEGLRALAVIPAVISDRVEGVLLVGSQRKLPENQLYFDQDEIKILYILARTIAEGQARERLTQTGDNSLIIPDMVISEQGETELYQALRNIADTIVPLTRAGAGMENSIILLAVRLEGYGRLFALSKEASEWFTHRVQRTLHDQLEHVIEDDWESPLSSRVFTLASDQFVGLIGRTKEDVRWLRQVIGERLDTLSPLISPDLLNVTVHVWSVHFTYNDLAQRFHIDKLTKESLDKLATHLLERTKGALKIVANVKRGDIYMRSQDYKAALAEYDIAERNDPNNPYVLRHQCECLTEMGLYEEAVKYGERAVEQDPEYASSYRRLADAFLELRDFDNALRNYRLAIQHAESDPEAYLRLAQALILQGEPDDLGVIIDTLNQAMGYDRPDNPTRAKYRRYQGDACLRYGAYRQAVTWYEQALRFDPENEELRWAFKSARHQFNIASNRLSS